MKNIIIVYNDDLLPKRGTEEDIISLRSVVKTSIDIEIVLIESGFDASRIALNSSNLINTIERIEKSKPCIIFNLCEAFDGDPSMEMNIAALFELLNIVYTGSPPAVIGLTNDKWKTKQILNQNNISVPRGIQINIDNINNLESLICNLQFPLFIKPLSEDGSLGIDRDSVVFNIDTLRKKVEYIFNKYNQTALIEEYIDGREFSISIIGNHPPFVLPLSEIDYSKLPVNAPKILCYKSKWMEESDIYKLTPSLCPANIDSDKEQKINEVALRTFKVTGCRDYARVDIRMREDKTPVVLEVNSNPDISINGGMAESAKTAGCSYKDMIKNILNTALERSYGNEN